MNTEGSVFFQHFLKFFSEEAFLNFYSKVIPKRLHGIRVNLFHDELSVAEEDTMYFLFINDKGKNRLRIIPHEM